MLEDKFNVLLSQYQIFMQQSDLDRSLSVSQEMIDLCKNDTGYDSRLSLAYLYAGDVQFRRAQGSCNAAFLLLNQFLQILGVCWHDVLNHTSGIYGFLDSQTLDELLSDERLKTLHEAFHKNKKDIKIALNEAEKEFKAGVEQYSIALCKNSDGFILTYQQAKMNGFFQYAMFLCAIGKDMDALSVCKQLIGIYDETKTPQIFWQDSFHSQTAQIDFMAAQAFKCMAEIYEKKRDYPNSLSYYNKCLELTDTLSHQIDYHALLQVTAPTILKIKVLTERGKAYKN